MPSYLQQIKTSSWGRSVSLKSVLSAGSKAAQNKLNTILGDKADGAKQKLWEVQAEILANELSQLKGAAMKIGQLIAVYGISFYQIS